MLVVKRILLLAGLWIVLTNGDGSALPFGAVAVAGATWLSFALLPARGGAVRLLPLFAMLPGFLWRSLLGGLDVAWRAFHPRLPIRPGWVVVQTRLEEGGARAALGGEFSLMPGTLVAGSSRDMLLIHCLDDRAPIEDAVRDEERKLLTVTGGEGPLRQP
jgi:multicomponent Na+:H+ antiporter subunit E